MPEFPLSRPDLKRTEQPREYRGRSGQDFEGARHWRLVQVSHYANLQPSQIVREMDAPDRGWDADPVSGDEHAPRAARQDATADADRQRENTELVTVDERRYVVDPIVDGHTFKGLWTGGPVLHVVAQGRKVLRQTLTRTWCAGHGYTTDENGAYIAVMTEGSDSDSDSDVREFRTAADCLKACRPWMDGRLSPYMAFRTDIPASYTREVYWREFTHESITPLENLTRDELVDVVTFHFGEKVGGTVMDAHTRLDPQTNTVIFVCNLLYRELSEPESPDDLLKLPCIDAPCTRDTLRMFGWNQLRNGEGYRYEHVFRWPLLKDTPKTRAIVEFLKDNPTLLSLLEKHRHLSGSDSDSDGNGWWAGYETPFPVVEQGNPPHLDNTGRLVTNVQTGTNESDSDGDEATDTPQVQHYRIAKQKTDIEQDGSLTFTVLVAKTEWHGYDDGKDYENGGQRQLASVSSPDGYGVTEHRVIPSVPRENAIPTMNAIDGDEWSVITQKSQSEGQEGGSDVSFQRQKVYDYITPEHTPFVVNVDGTNFNAPDYRYDPETNIYSLSFPQVQKESVQPLIDALRGKLGSDPKIRVVDNGSGSCTVSVTGRALQPRHVKEWVVEADWFQHQTMEQWIGVATNITKDGSDSDSDGDDIKGFYSRYVKNEQTGMLEPVESSWIPLAAVRGDLDADWMGSDPQSKGSGPRAPVLYYSIGVSDAKKQRTDIEHEDEHGDGWGGGDWSDPDDSGDSADKLRSHTITRVHPRVNGDGTLDLSITRIYPHQRKWEWETEKGNGKKDGEWKPVYHIEYRNWPSRHAIKRDIVERWAALKNVDLKSDDWIYHFTPNVNKFGLVDAANVVIEPLFYQSNKSRGDTDDGQGITNGSTYKFYRFIGKPYKARVSPDGVDHAPAFAPLLGYYFGVTKKPIYYGHFTSQQAADEAWASIAGKCGDVYDGQESQTVSGSGTNWNFKFVGLWTPSKIVYNGMPPTPADSVEHSRPGPQPAQKVNSNGSQYLTRKTWELWYTGKSQNSNEANQQNNQQAGGNAQNGGGN